MFRSRLLLVLVLVLQTGLPMPAFSQPLPPPASDSAFHWNLRTRPDSASVYESQQWDAASTAFLVCDMWDYHHSVNAVRRLKEFAPRLDAVLAEARRRGATIIHAPSDCMPFYQNHAARERALAVPPAENAPAGMAEWCHRIPAEEQATYPIDQSNGGEDDDLAEHARWAAFLESIGRNPGTPWKRQTDLLRIDPERDFVCAEGDVVWNVLQSRGIDRVVLTGVHTNMCVLGRPFGLRQMKRAGQQVVLMRDMTDVMYEPNSWPYVSHFTGIDLVVEHIERFVCPTVTSDQVVGGRPFRFRGDHRSRAAVLWLPALAGQDESLPRKLRFLQTQLQPEFQVSLIGGPGEDLERADLLVIPSRFFASPAIAAFEATGRPIVGEPVGARETRKVRATGGSGSGPSDSFTKLLQQVDRDGIGQLDLDSYPQYEARFSQVVLGPPQAPAAWIGVRPDSGRSLCVMPGENNARLILNGCYWAVDRTVPVSLIEGTGEGEGEDLERRWATRVVPEAIAELAKRPGTTWWRCQALIPRSWQGQELRLELGCFGDRVDLYFNGHGMANGDPTIPVAHVIPGALNTVAVRLQGHPEGESGLEPASAALRSDGGERLALQGRWQVRAGDDATWARFPIPPQFGASTDHILEVTPRAVRP